MSQEQSMQLVMECCISHRSEQRLMKAYRRLWQMQQTIQSSPINNPTDKEDGNGTSSTLRPGFDS